MTHPSANPSLTSARLEKLKELTRFPNRLLDAAPSALSSVVESAAPMDSVKKRSMKMEDRIEKLDFLALTHELGMFIWLVII